MDKERPKEVEKMKKIVGLLAVVAMFVLLSMNAAALFSPFGVKGFILHPDGSQYASGSSIIINDTNSYQVQNISSGGPTGAYNGFYSASVNGSYGDWVDMVAYNGTHYGRTRVKLTDDHTDQNVTVNINNDAPWVTLVTVTPANPAANTDLMCVVDNAWDPNGVKIEKYNYTWTKNGVEQPADIFKFEADNDTLFYLDFDTTWNATYAAGADWNASAHKGAALIPGKIGNATNFSFASGDALDYNTSGNFNYTDGTIEFWINFNSFVANGWIVATEYDIANKFWLRQLVAAGDKKINFLYAGANLLSDALDWNPGEWHYIAVTWSTLHTTTADTTYVQMFLDGVLEGDTSTGTPISNIYSNFSIGKRQGAFGIEAMIDEFRISSRSRTPYEIMNTYSQRVAQKNLTAVSDTWTCSAAPINVNNLTGFNLPATNSVQIGSTDVQYAFYNASRNISDVQAGRAAALVVTVTNAGIPVEHATVKAEETNGLSLFGYVQTATSGNYTNTQSMTGVTNSSGQVEFLVIPSEARVDVGSIIEDYVGPYNIKIMVDHNGQLIYDDDVVVERKHRAYDKYTIELNAGSTFPNTNDYTAALITKMLNAYNKAAYFLRGFGTG